MTSLINQIPAFWQGVVASIFGGMFLAVLGYVFSTSLKQWKRSVSSQRNIRNAVVSNLTASGMIPRIEASIYCLFQTIKYLFFANIFWVLPETLYLFVEFAILVKIISLAFFVLGLKWIYLYTANQSVTSTSEDERGKINRRIQFKT